MLHRDLTEPGKNALLRRDSLGLTAVLIDLSQAEVREVILRTTPGSDLLLLTPSVPPRTYCSLK